MPRRKLAEPLLWFGFLDAKGAAWNVYLTSREITPFMAEPAPLGRLGFCDRDLHAIYINAAMPVDEQNAVALHEVAHAILKEHILKRIVTKRREETIVEAITSQLYPFCELHGMRFPRRPKGYSVLRRAAVAQALFDEEEE